MFKTKCHLLDVWEKRKFTQDGIRENAEIEWKKHVEKHLKMNPGCDISKNEMCKHWFILGFIAAYEPQ
jgi:hypothetical protein